MLKQRLLTGAVICLVLGIASSLSMNIWFTRVILSSEEVRICPEPFSSVPISCSPVETKVPDSTEFSLNISGRETGIPVVGIEEDESSRYHLPQPFLTDLEVAPKGPDEPDYSISPSSTSFQTSDTKDLPSESTTNRSLLHESVITFDWDKHTLGLEANRNLEATIQTLYRYPESTVEIAAHTDRTGARDYNKQLSRRRAHAVMAFLMKKGIAEIRIWWKSYGSSQPIDLDNTPVARSKNRRAEIRVWGYSM
uniref:OmpA family protein n=1 Tax=Candidatus Kentrum sp. TUN TaxID=2126343 RepID=A0A450ZXT3_9GAMM|nr:MAG: OmpA family protein [Candidatus Kentron sp. TUN]VFK58573.1 MAG: OmpA family protein [Candidatus Kentron sp. TUN]VFK61167.1 MAG: OmpA family protein [Candidatus Kentron sp. TUN]